MSAGVRVLLALALLWSGAAAGAETKAADKPAAMPDPATVSVPDLSQKPGPRERPDTTIQFYFHKTGASFAEAVADYTECNSYSAKIELFAPPPKTVPYGSDPVGIDWDPYGAAFQNFGLVGVAMMGIVHDGLVRSWERGNIRRCMGYKGYRRYGAPNAVWKQINSGPQGEIVVRLAVIASGPAPQAEELAP